MMDLFKDKFLLLALRLLLNVRVYGQYISSRSSLSSQGIRGN